MKTLIKKIAVSRMTPTGRMLHVAVEKSMAESGIIPWQLHNAIEEWLSTPKSVTTWGTKLSRRSFGNLADDYVLVDDMMDAGRARVTASIMQQVSNNWQPPMADVVESPKVSGGTTTGRMRAAPVFDVGLLSPPPTAPVKMTNDDYQNILKGMNLDANNIPPVVHNEAMRQLLRDMRAEGNVSIGINKKVNK